MDSHVVIISNLKMRCKASSDTAALKYKHRCEPLPRMSAFTDGFALGRIRVSLLFVTGAA